MAAAAVADCWRQRQRQRDDSGGWRQCVGVGSSLAAAAAAALWWRLGAVVAAAAVAWWQRSSSSVAVVAVVAVAAARQRAVQEHNCLVLWANHDLHIFVLLHKVCFLHFVLLCRILILILCCSRNQDIMNVVCALESIIGVFCAAQ